MSALEKPRVYGCWAGNPQGRPEDPKRCIEAIYGKYSYGGKQCSRPRGFGPDGLHCKQHDPVEIKRKSDMHNAKWDAQIANERREHDYKSVGARLADVNPELFARILEDLKK